MQSLDGRVTVFLCAQHRSQQPHKISSANFSSSDQSQVELQAPTSAPGMGATMKLLMMAVLLKMGACGTVTTSAPVITSNPVTTSAPATTSTPVITSAPVTFSARQVPAGSCALKVAPGDRGYLIKDNGEYLTSSCFQPQCDAGTWKYTGQHNYTCGECFFGGEPIVYLFDELVMSGVPAVGNPNLISVDVDGEYVMTALGSRINLGVTGHFVSGDAAAGGPCGAKGYTSCINGFIYYQDDIAVKLELENGIIKVYEHAGTYIEWSSDLWSNTPVNMKSGTATLTGLNGVQLLVFEVPIIIMGGRDCTIVIGIKGLTVTLCKESASAPHGYPWAGIYAMPSLQALPGGTAVAPDTLYGLCNVWTGEKHTFFNKGAGGTGKTYWWQEFTTKDHNGVSDIRKLKKTIAAYWKVTAFTSWPSW